MLILQIIHSCRPSLKSLVKPLVGLALVAGSNALGAVPTGATEGEWVYSPTAAQGGTFGPAWCYESGGKSVVIKQFGPTGLTNVSGTLDAVVLTIDPTIQPAGNVYFLPRSTCLEADLDAYNASASGTRLVSGCIDSSTSGNVTASSGSADIGNGFQGFVEVPAGPYVNFHRWYIAFSASGTTPVTVNAFITEPVEDACVPVPQGGDGEGGDGDGGDSVGPAPFLDFSLDSYMQRVAAAGLPDTL